MSREKAADPRGRGNEIAMPNDPGMALQDYERSNAIADDGFEFIQVVSEYEKSSVAPDSTLCADGGQPFLVGTGRPEMIAVAFNAAVLQRRECPETGCRGSDPSRDDAQRPARREPPARSAFAQSIVGGDFGYLLTGINALGYRCGADAMRSTTGRPKAMAKSMAIGFSEDGTPPETKG